MNIGQTCSYIIRFRLHFFSCESYYICILFHFVFRLISHLDLYHMNQLLIHSAHLFSLSNMKKISIFLRFLFGNMVGGVSFILALYQWRKFSRGKIVQLKMLYENQTGLAKLMSNGITR